jgi:hypothetical protein
MNAVRIAFAVVVMTAFGVFAYFLVANADTSNQTEWERWVYVFGGVEAIAFAAVGWLFGREVNRERAEKAEEGANDADEKEKTERAKGAHLAGLVVAAAGGGEGRQRLEAQGVATAGGLKEAVDFARREYT